MGDKQNPWKGQSQPEGQETLANPKNKGVEGNTDGKRECE
jgi:hypothetical protein